MIKETLRQILSFVGLQLRNNSFPRYNRLEEFAVNRNEWNYQDGKIYLRLLDILVTKNSPLVFRYDLAKELYKKGGRFFYDEKSRLRMSINGCNFFINFRDELYVISEVFVSGVYNVKMMDEFVVIDIGLNIGATSLFFSKQKNVKHIYAYELFRPTFAVALENMSINDASKITPINIGLGKETKELNIPYSITSKARMGLYGLPESEIFPDAEEVLVWVKDAAEEIRRIHTLEPNVRKLCKMDCEGAEFDILDRLFQQDVASLIDIYIIEWHNRSIHDIEQQFMRQGFDIVKIGDDDASTGLVYAFKKKNYGLCN